MFMGKPHEKEKDWICTSNLFLLFLALCIINCRSPLPLAVHTYEVSMDSDGNSSPVF
jgi:hypothetical protein